MLSTPRHSQQTRTLTPRAHTYRLISSKYKIKPTQEARTFTNLNSDIIASSKNISIKHNLSIRRLNTQRMSTAISHNLLRHDRSPLQEEKNIVTISDEVSFDIEFQVNGTSLKMNSSATTVGQLVQQIKKNLESRRIKSKQFVLESITNELALNYYLTLPAASTSVFYGTKLKLQLYFTTNQPVVGLNSFQIYKCIGSGGFSKVFLVRFKENGLFYAMKVISKSFITKNKKQQLIMNQRNIMAQISHPLHAQLHWTFQSKHSIVFVMDFYPGGELFGLIKRFRRMNEDMAKFYLTEVLLALEKLHDSGVAYRDIKPQNILLDREGHAHLADFGLVKPGLKGDTTRAYSFCGSPEYMPPEIVARKGHTLTADFYSIGALLYELVTGLPPFYSRDPEKIYSATLKQKMIYPSNLSEDLKNVLQGLLCKDSEKRLGAKFGVRQILSQPWFGKVDLKSFLQKKVQAPVKFNKLSDLKFSGLQNSSKQEVFLQLMKQQQNTTQNFHKMLTNFEFSSHFSGQTSCQSRQEKARPKNINIFNKFKRRTEENYTCLVSQLGRVNNFF